MATTESVENYPGFDEGIDGFELGERMQRGAERFGAQTFFAELKSVELAGDPKTVVTSRGIFSARALVIATGARPKSLGLENESLLTGKGVAYCAACDGMRYKGKAVVVNGGGNSAVTEALYLSKICSKVFLVHRRESLRASRVYADALKQSGAEIVFNNRVAKLRYDKTLTGVELEDVTTGFKRIVDCSALFVAIGRAPETELFKGQVETDETGYIVADETTRTSVAGVFAVGDVRTKPLRQIVTAAADGATASRFVEEYLK